MATLDVLNVPKPTQATSAPKITSEQVHNLGVQNGIDQQTMGFIYDKASNNVGMDTVTPEKQAVYDMYQQYLTQETIAKAQQGQSLLEPTAWKQSIYDQNAPANQFEAQSNAKLESMQQWLQQQAQAQIDQQKAMLGQARDAELAALQKSLQDAIAQGELSVREAQAQFDKAKQGIDQQAYTDSQFTNLVSQQRGIGNSMQSIGLIQGDQARTNSLTSEVTTARDKQISDITTQLNNIKNNISLDMASAESKYNYGLASATGQINADMMAQMTNMTWQDYQRLQQFGMDEYMQDKEFNFSREQLETQQKYTQENMHLQHGFDLDKLSTQQRYTLEQMAIQNGYDLNKMSVQQQYDLAKMAEAYGYDMSLQKNQQSFQAQQAALDRSHATALQNLKHRQDLSYLSAQQKAEADKYDTELQRKIALYKPGTPEHEALTLESNFMASQYEKENTMKMLAEVGQAQMASLVASYPKTLPDLSNKSAVDKYNSQVSSVNNQLQKLLGSQSSAYLRDLETAYAKKTGKSVNTSSVINSIIKSAGASVKSVANNAANALLR